MTLLDSATRDALFKLPEDERAALADALIASLDEPTSEPEIVGKAWASEIRQRIESLVAGTASTTPGEQARAEIRAARAAAQQQWESSRQTELASA